MNTQKLPPLKSLRAFEAAARHLSFAQAAEELFVTPGAISQQIRVLEQHLGVELFRRQHRRVLLTDAGQSLLPGVRQGFQLLGSAVDDVQSMKSDRPVTISAAPSFASKWLVPRLGDLHRRYPELDIRLDTSMEVIDLNRSDIDIGIRFGAGDYPGLHVDLLICEEVFPVCSPTLINPDHPLNEPGDIIHYPLLHYATGSLDLGAGWPDWQMWLKAAGVDYEGIHHGFTIDQQQMLIQAALESQGIALVGSVSVMDDLKSGRLIRPFELTFPVGFSYYFVTTEAKAGWPQISAVREWMLEQAADYVD